MNANKQKILITLAVAGILGGSAAALAEPWADGCPNQGGPGMMRGAMRGMPADPAARVERRLSLLKTELKLTAEQEPLWLAFAEKSKAEAGKGFQTMRDQAQDGTVTAPERMAKMASLLKDRATAMESVNESFKRLYDVLTPEQKKTADQFASRMGHRGPASGPRGPRPGPGAGNG